MNCQLQPSATGGDLQKSYVCHVANSIFPDKFPDKRSLRMIDVLNFCKAYDDLLAVDSLSFSVAPGEILGLVGPNGAGKTTTLRALSGIVTPSHGELSVDGHSIDRDPIEAKRRLAYIPDDPPLFPDMTVDEHLTFSAGVYNVSNPEPKASALLERFRLHDKRQTAARNLSRGMRQKLAISCAYLYDPSAILLDEPMTGLDPHGIRVLKKTISERAAKGAAVVVSSHLLAMVEDLCTHVLILDRGQAQFFGTIDKLRSHFAGEAPSETLEEIFFQATDLAKAASDATVQVEAADQICGS